MDGTPAFLLDALRFQDPRWEALHGVKDSEWKSILSDWRVVRLVLPLRQTCGRDLPDWVSARIDTHLRDNAVRFERIKHVYSIAAAAFKEANADHVVLKGFSLWPGYVEHPRFRPQSDIDLYCPPGSIARARDALTVLGYQTSPRGGHLPKDHLSAMTPQTSWQWRGNFFDPDIPISFELHFCWWDSAWTRIYVNRLEEFWSRRGERQLDEITFPALRPMDNLGYVALNLLRDLLRGGIAAEQIYGLARFLHTNATDRTFWRDWQSLHDDSLRRLEMISFHLASNLFACRLSEEVQEEMERLPAAVRAWFQHFPNSVLWMPFHRRKDAVWLHLNLLESCADKSFVLFRRLVSLPIRVPTFESVLADQSSTDRPPEKSSVSKVARISRQSIQYGGWVVSRVVAHLSVVPLTISRGLGYWLRSRNLSRQFWTFFAASFCFDLGMTMFFFMYNLYLLDRGYQEDFLGLMTGAINIGSVACTIPAGFLVQRLGLRRSLLFCFFLVASVSAARALFAPRSALLGLALLGGFVITIWAVAISPAIARLTDEQNRPYGFSLVFSSGIGVGILANLVASRMPAWFTRLSPTLGSVHAKQLTLLIACGIVALGLLPLSRLKFAPLPAAHRKLDPRNPFLWRFLPAMAVWSLVTGSLSPLSNVYFSRYLRMPLEHMGVIFSFSNVVQVLGVLAAPFLFRKLGLIRGIVSTQLATAVSLAILAANTRTLPAAVIYVGYTGFLWMSAPGLFALLMDRVAPAEQAGASALNFLVISLAQAIAVVTAGASFSRLGYPVVLAAMAGAAITAALLFWCLLGRNFVIGSIALQKPNQSRQGAMP